MTFRIQLAKEDFKFSCSHFTIFGPGRAERLHGHNYQVRCELAVQSLDVSLGMAFDFNDVKPLLREIVHSLDEYVLLPELSPFLEIVFVDETIRAQFGHKRYELPTEDVRLLPVTNITSEELARWIAEELSRRLTADRPTAAERINTLSIAVEETRGQSVVYQLNLRDLGS